MHSPSTSPTSPCWPPSTKPVGMTTTRQPGLHRTRRERMKPKTSSGAGFTPPIRSTTPDWQWPGPVAGRRWPWSPISRQGCLQWPGPTFKTCRLGGHRSRPTGTHPPCAANTCRHPWKRAHSRSTAHAWRVPAWRPAPALPSRPCWPGCARGGRIWAWFLQTGKWLGVWRRACQPMASSSTTSPAGHSTPPWPPPPSMAG